jgi:predicted nuclease of predicted toxin-antitoxin system
VSAIAFLREAGHDVLHVREVELNELPDEDILEAAIREQRVVVSHDLDFPRVVALSGAALGLSGFCVQIHLFPGSDLAAPAVLMAS